MARIDSPTFERCVRESLAEVYRAAFRVIRREPEAQDVTQQVFLDLLEGKVPIGEARDGTGMLCWRAVRRAISELRGEERRQRRRKELKVRTTQRADDDQHRSLEEREVIEEAWRRVAALPEALRIPLELHYQEGFTQKAIAEALEVSEPTVNVRLRKGLERLRRGFAGAALSAAPVRLEALLGHPRPVPVPAGLEARVLALPAAAATVVPVAAMVWTAVLSLGIVVGGGIWWHRGAEAGRTPPERPMTASLEREARDGGDDLPLPPPLRTRPFVPPPSATEATAPVPSGVRQPPRATIRGSVVSSEGRVLAGLVVRAVSYEIRGKGPLAGTEGRTDDAGHFELEVEAVVGDRRAYRLQIVDRGHFVHLGREAWVRAGEVVEAGQLRLREAVLSRPGRYELELLVLDEDDRPCAGARVKVVRLHGGPRPDGRPGVEAEGRTDGAGIVRLRGDALGGKRVIVEPGDPGLAPWEGMITLDEAGLIPLHVALARGLSIAGSVRTIDGVVPEGAALSFRRPGTERWHHARVDAAGRFEVSGLAAGPWKVVVCDDFSGRFPRWSPQGLEEVAAGTRDLEIVLKPLHDVRDLGTHAAELHGRVVDPSGTPLATDAVSLTLRRVPEHSREVLARDLLPDLLPPFMGQVAAGPGREGHPPEEFHRGGLGPGAWVVRVELPGYAPRIAGPWVLREEQIRADLEITLDRGFTVTGVVTSLAGDPLEGALVYPTGHGRKAEEMLASRDETLRQTRGRGFLPFGGVARSDAVGRFRLEHVPADLPLRLAVLHPDHRPAFGPALDPASPDPITLSLAGR